MKPNSQMKNSLTLAIVMTVLSIASTASAATTLVNLDFNVTGALGPSGSFAGSGPLGGGTWNNPSLAFDAQTSRSTTASSLLDSTGATTGIGVTVASFYNAYDTGVTNNIHDSLEPLFSDYLYIYRATVGTSTSTITLSGLGAGTQWNLVLFGAHGGTTAGSGAKFTIGGVSKSTLDAGGIGATLTEGDEYVRYSNLTSNGSGNIVVTWDRKTTTAGTYGVFNGFQLQQVPEPSAALLGALGMLVMLLRRRR